MRRGRESGGQIHGLGAGYKAWNPGRDVDSGLKNISLDHIEKEIKMENVVHDAICVVERGRKRSNRNPRKSNGEKTEVCRERSKGKGQRSSEIKG